MGAECHGIANFISLSILYPHADCFTAVLFRAHRRKPTKSLPDRPLLTPLLPICMGALTLTAFVWQDPPILKGKVFTNYSFLEVLIVQ